MEMLEIALTMSLEWNAREIYVVDTSNEGHRIQQ